MPRKRYSREKPRPRRKCGFGTARSSLHPFRGHSAYMRCMDAKEEERRWMGRVARGDEAAFGELVGRYGGRRLGVARRLLGSRADAEGAVQRALLECYLGAGPYRSEWAVSTWLYRILSNVCMDELRRRKSRSGELEPPARPDPDRKSVV